MIRTHSCYYSSTELQDIHLLRHSSWNWEQEVSKAAILETHHYLHDHDVLRGQISTVLTGSYHQLLQFQSTIRCHR